METLESLKAEMTQEEMTDALNRSLKKIESGYSSLNDNISGEFLGLRNFISEGNQTVNQSFDKIAVGFKKLNAKIDLVEKKLNVKIDSSEKKLSTKIGNLEKKVDKGFEKVLSELRSSKRKS